MVDSKINNNQIKNDSSFSNREKVVVCWSGGKDSALALHEMLTTHKDTYEVVGLMTTINDEINRVTMHGVRKELIRKQSEVIGIPLIEMITPLTCTYEDYERVFLQTLDKIKELGVSKIVFGDIFLEDLKKYREDLLAKKNMTCLLPIWKIDTKEIMRRNFELKIEAIIVCGNTKYFKEESMGSIINEAFLSTFHAECDPAGENGEFHTYVVNAPYFKERIETTLGERLLKTWDFNVKVEENKTEEKCEENNIETKKQGNDEETTTNLKQEKVGFWYIDLLLKENLN